VQWCQEELDRSDETTVILRLDIKNAFNTRRRKKILESLYSNGRLAHLFRYADFCYGRPTDIIMLNRKGKVACVIKSSEGVAQGCPNGSALFAVSMFDVIAAVEEQVPGVRVKLLHDDSFLAGPPALVRKAYEVFKQAAEADLSFLQPAKSQAICWRFDSLPADFKEWINQQGFEVVTDAVEIAGGVVAANANAADRVCDGILGQHRIMMDRLRHPHFPHQAAMILLRASLLPAMNHLMRASRPEFTRGVCQKFDAWVLDTARDLLDSPLSPNSPQLAQLTLSINSGGYGLRSCLLLHEFAWLASLARTRQILESTPVSPATKATRARVLQKIYREFDRDHEDKLQSLKEQIPKPSECFDRFYASDPELADELQAQLSAIVTKNAKAFAAPADQPETVNRLKSISQPNASAFLLQLPGDSKTKLSNAEYSAIAQLRLCSTPSDMPEFCGRCNAPLGPSVEHFVGCNKYGAESIRRHNGIRDGVATVCKAVPGMDVKVEPWGMYAEDERRIDLFIKWFNLAWAVDIRVCHLNARSNLAVGDEAAMHRAAQAKIRKYQDLETLYDCKVVPFIVDTFGRLGEEAKSFLQAVENAAAESGSETSPSEVRKNLMAAISLALQRGNAAMITAGLADSRRAQARAQRASGNILLQQLSLAGGHR
jgi:hypothetical protein